MYAVKGTSIRLVVGDTFAAQIALTKNGNEYELQEGDQIRFAMKKSYKCSTCLIMKQIDINTMILKLDPEETEGLQVGSYVYDIQVTFANGDVDTVITVTAEVTRAQLDNIALRHYVGYYGGLVRGISFEVTYSTGSGLDHYTYTYTVDGNATIVVTIGGSTDTDKLYVKNGRSWQEVATAYKKVGGVWVQQDITTLFDSSKKYRRG